MNKKNLSVVLAGAMLATSVAPVLADTTTAKEYSLDDIKLLENEIVSTMKKAMLTTNSILKSDTELVSSEVQGLLNAGMSAYGVVVLDSKGNEVDNTYDVDEVDDILAKAKSGYTVKVVKRETSEFYGQLIPGTTPRKVALKGKYTPATDFLPTAIKVSTDQGVTHKQIVVKESGTGNALLDSTANSGNALKADKSDATATKLTVYTNKLVNEADSSKGKVTITLTKDSDKIDGRLPLDEKGNLLDIAEISDVQKFDHFDTLADWEASKEIKTAPKEEAVYKIISAKEDPNAIKVSDLYDGMLLTAKGTELLSDLTNAAEEVKGDVDKVTTAIGKNDQPSKAYHGALVKLSDATFSDSSVYKFTVKYYKNATDAATTNGNGANEYKTVTVHSTDKTEIEALYKLLRTGSFNVGIVGGANRYETAVNVAKAQGAKIDDDNKNIVLVNGLSLVDGLAAAPLAASVNTNGDAAPVLLSNADSLPESTKEYLKSLTNGLTATEKKGVTINLVGGEAVLTSSLVAELEDMGFYVKRLGGDNRETTSLEVAKEIAKAGNTNAAFVVGGNGEADAMSISAVAASSKTPIIVSSVHGISEDALEYLKEKSAKGDVTVVGGESVVSASELEEINDSLALNKASRIAGENRFETNAKIIEEYYGDKATASEGIIIAKDGVAKKSELVDALSAANYAVSIKAPIVLASSSLKDVQKSALVNKLNMDAAVPATKGKVVQVGNSAERSVIETVAKLFNIHN